MLAPHTSISFYILCFLFTFYKELTLNFCSFSFILMKSVFDFCQYFHIFISHSLFFFDRLKMMMHQSSQMRNNSNANAQGFGPRANDAEAREAAQEVPHVTGNAVRNMRKNRMSFYLACVTFVNHSSDICTHFWFYLGQKEIYF